MIQLVAYTQAGEVPVNLDLGDETSVRLNFAFADPGAPLTRQAPYSGAFTLPFSAKNNVFFGHWYSVNLVSGTFAADVRTRAEVRSEGMIVTEGYLQLRSVSLTAETYEVSVLGTTGELFNKLADATLSEVLTAMSPIGLDDYDYAPTAANVIDSWDTTNDITNGSIGAGVVVVPLADYGNTPGGRLFYDFGVADGLNSANYLQPYHLKPAMQVKHIIEKCFEYAGMTLSSTFLTTSPMTDLYLLLSTASKELATRPYYGSRVGLTSGVTVTSGNQAQITGWTASGAGNYDPDAHMTTYGFTAPADMTALFEVSLCCTNYTATSVGYVRLVKGGTVAAVAPFMVNASGDAVTPVVVLTAEVSLLQGEYLEVYVGSAFSTGNIVIAATPNTYFKFISYSSFSAGAIVAPLDGLPQVKAAEFLRELVERFNLVVVTDSEDERVVRIEPMMDYLLTGEERDWSGLVNRDGPMVLSPLTDLRKKRLRFTDGVDNDYLNQYHQANFGMALGDYGFTAADEFAQGDLTTPTLCGSTALYPVTTSNVTTSVHLTQVSIPTYYGATDTGEAEAVSTKPKLLFYNELKTIVNPIYVGATSVTEYPHFSPFTDRVIGASTWSLYWRHTFSYSTLVVGEQFAQGLYDRFWAQYLTDLYDPAARMLDCEVVLSAADVRNLSFADVIRIDNETYRVVSLADYNPDDTGVARARLLKTLTNVKLIAPGRPCELVLTATNANGSTTWETPAGSPATPTADCCEAAGYYWDGTTCWWSRPTTGGGGTNPASDFLRSGEHFRPPRSMPGSAGPIRIPVRRTTASEIASMPNGIFPYADGRDVYLTSNTSGFSLGAHQRYLLCATTSGRTIEVASPRGVLDSGGAGAGVMVLRDNITTHVRARLVGVDVASYLGTGIGEYQFIEKLFVVQCDNAVVRIREDLTLEHHHSGGRVQSEVGIRAAVGTDVVAGANTVEITIDGKDADRVTSWLIDVDLTLIDTTAAEAFLDSILHEDSAPLSMENNSIIITE